MGQPPTAGHEMRGILMGVGLLLALALLIASYTVSQTPDEQKLTLADGSTLELMQVLFTNSVNYAHQERPRWVELLAPLIPDAIEGRFFPGASGSFGFSASTTNLILITEWRPGTTASVQPQRIRIRDEQGNAFDAKEGAHTLGLGSLVVNGWQLPAFPRRAQKLTAEFLGDDGQGRAVLIGSLPVENPAPAEHPQWTAEPLPQSRVVDGLTVSLERFESGNRGSDPEPDDALARRSTSLEVSFTKDGRPTRDHELHRLTIADASGNRFQPFFDRLPVRTSINWMHGGFAEFVGALWPGENAWRLELDTIQVSNHVPAELWTPDPLPLPAAGGFTRLTNTFTVGAMRVKMPYVLAPSVVVTNDWQWVLRYWGNEPNVYVVALDFPEGRERREPVIVLATGEDGRAAELVENREWDDRHALFFKLPMGATELRLKFAFPELRKFEFLARPDFVGQPASPAVAR